MRKVVILCALFALIGCGRWTTVALHDIDRPSPKFNYIYSNNKNYAIGEKKTVFVGQEIVIVKEYMQSQYIPMFFVTKAISADSLSAQFRYKFTNYKINIPRNEVFPVTEAITIYDKEYYLIRVLFNYFGQWGIVVDEKGKIYEQGVYNFYHKMMYFPDTMTITSSGFKLLTDAMPESKPVQTKSYELIFSGKNDVSLNVTYREYSGSDLARPAFYQVLTYEGNAKQIRFKDFIIKIHDVNNEKITYTVLADGLK